MTHATVTVNQQGRVLIPAQLRKELGIRAESSLVAFAEDGRLVLEDRDHLARRLQHEAAASRTSAGDVVAELLASRRAEAARERTELDADR